MVGEGIQEWTVPKNGTYRIRAYSAQGGPFDTDFDGKTPESFGGKGAYMEGEFELTKGETYNIVVGQQPAYSAGDGNGGSGGGGGTFIYTGAVGGDGLLVAAGGGAGSISPGNSISNASETEVSQDGVTTRDAADGWHEDGTRVPGGENGDGGSAANIGGNGDTGGGSGWKSDGESVSTLNSGSRGQRFVGGRPFCADSNPNSGGWGGGAGSGENRDTLSGDCNDFAHGSGGGGGYSEGGSSTYYIDEDHHGGGGGSFISSEGDVVDTESGSKSGNGLVEIELIESGEVNFCNFRGPFNECIINQTNSLSPRQFNVSKPLLVRPDAVFTAFSGRSIINVTNSTSLSGSWRGEFTVKAESPEIGAGTRLEPRGGDIVIGG